MIGVIKKIKKTIDDMDKPLLIVTILLLIFGTLNIVTASSREAVSNNTSLYHYFYKQLIILFIGFIIFIIGINIKTKNYKKYAFIGFLGIFALLVYLTLFGSYYRGANNWIKIMGFTFQPSEFAKPIIIVCLAILFELFYKRLRTKNINHFNMISVILFFGVSIPTIIFLQKDFGTMLIILAIFGIMFLASPILRIEKLKTIGVMLVLVLIFCFMMIAKNGSVFTDEQNDRLNFFNPCSNYEEGGYQICNAFIAINNGGLFGLGIGKSQQKYSYIPEPHTDSVFAIFAEEWGLIMCFVIFVTYIFILYRIFDISSKATSIKNKYMALGIGTYIFMHILINLGGLFGVLPLTGVPLPFLSYGGSFTLSLILSLTIVQRIHIETKNERIKIK